MNPGFTVLRPGDAGYEWKPPSWRPEEPVRRIVELPLHATMRHSRAHLWRYPAGAQGRFHKPLVQEEVFLVVDGTMTIELGEAREEFELPPRSMVVVEPGTPLKLSNRSGEEATLFIYGAPTDGAAELLES
jgi:mannose-6-phosphate isomerase-like protein (cupin superfamily)